MNNPTLSLSAIDDLLDTIISLSKHDRRNFKWQFVAFPLEKYAYDKLSQYDDIIRYQAQCDDNIFWVSCQKDKYNFEIIFKSEPDKIYDIYRPDDADAQKKIKEIFDIAVSEDKINQKIYDLNVNLEFILG